MSSLNRPLSGKALFFRLGEENRAEFIDENLLVRAGRSARTLVKEGALRITLVSLGAEGVLAEHHSEGPISVHVLSGEIRFTAGADEWLLGPGDLLSLGGGVPHSVESSTGGVFLLTVAVPSA